MKKIGFIVCILIFFSVLGIGYAQQSAQELNLTSSFDKAIALSMGGAWRSLAEGTNAILVNPSGLSFKKSTGFGFDYLGGDYLGSRILSGGVYDSKSFDVSGGLFYERNDLVIDGRNVSVNQFAVAMGRSISQVFSAGTNVKYIHIGRSLPSGGDLDRFTGDFGMSARPIPELAFAAVLQNFYNGTKDPEVPLIAGLAMAAILGDSAKLSVDMDIDFSTRQSSRTNFYFGGEVTLTQGICFRAGYGLDRVRDNPYFGTGIGFYGPKLVLNFTFAERLNPIEQIYALSAQLITF